MTPIEFVKSSQTNSERCLYILYYELIVNSRPSLTTKVIREKLSQARIPKVKDINVSDALSKSGHLVDYEGTKNERQWKLTQSGIQDIENKLLKRLGAIPHLSKLPRRNFSGKQLDILFLGLGPINEDRLRLDEETREIETKIRASEHRDTFQFKSKWAVRPPDLFQYLHENKPHILHLSGHGSPSGGIAFEDNKGESKLVAASALADALSTMKDNLKVVLLNACYSSIAAEEIASSIGCAIGMSDAIDDRSAITFSATFYSSLGFGNSVLRAFREARSMLVMEGLPGDHLLELFVQDGLDPDLIVLVDDK